MEDGINIKGVGQQVLSRELYQEAIILSDMYELNEFVALDLLCTAQIQMSYYYGLPRGLVSVLLYYDGRKCVTSCLKLLVQARKGVSWSINIQSDLVNSITAFTDQLLENGLFNRIFELLRTLDLSKELEKLQENMALGGPRHRRQVIDLFNDIKQNLAEIIFLWSTQCGLPREPSLGLINYMRQLKVEEDASGTIDNVSFYLLMSLLSIMDLSIMHIREDGDDIVQTLPILSDKDFLNMLINEMSQTKPKWVSEGLQATATLGYVVMLSCLRLVPQGLELQHVIEREVNALALAIEMKLFSFLNQKILNNKLVYSDEIITRRLHYLLTDFIIQLFGKVKELRIKADETARMSHVYIHEGLEPPSNLPRYFEEFLEVISNFYSKDPLDLKYSLDYWCPSEGNTTESYLYRLPPRSVSLFKFVKLAGDLVPSSLFVPYVNMISSLSTCQQSARHCFNMLKQTTSNTISWDHFFISFNQYYNSLRQEAIPAADTIYRRSIFPKGITPQEIKGLHAVLRLIRTIAENDEFSRLALCEHPDWTPLTILLGLVGCSVPIKIKADLLTTLAGLCKSQETALQMWNNIESSQILVTVPTTSSYQPRGIQTELDEVESRLEEYPLTLALLVMLDVLSDSGIPRTLGAGHRRPGFDPYLNFIVHSVFLKYNSRAYRNPEERWVIANKCLKLLEKFLMQYEPQASDFSNKTNDMSSPPGYHILLQLNSKSEFLNLLLCILEDALVLFEQYLPFTGKIEVEECALRCLELLDRALVLQPTFSNLLTSSTTPVLLTSLNKLLLVINPRSGQPDHCVNLSKFIGLHFKMPRHTSTALKILLHVTNTPVLHTQFLNILLTKETESKIIKNGFVECLDAPISQEENEIFANIKENILKLFKQCLLYTAPNLSHFLLGFDLKRDVSQTLFQHPGVLDFPRGCLHAIFSMLKTVITKEIQPPPSSVLEAAYHTLYLLSANAKTSEPVLRYLRSIPGFFQEHLVVTTECNQVAWLLKTVAIELKITCNNNQIFYLQQLCKLLMGPGDELLLKLLDSFDLVIEEIVAPRWNYFDGVVLDNLLVSCQTEPHKFIDIKKLHKTLLEEIGNHANSAMTRRQSVIQEIQMVLMHALNINNSRSAAITIKRFVNAWRQVVEVLAVYVPYHVLPTQMQKNLSFAILEYVSKVNKLNLVPEVARYFSGVVLVLLENILKCRQRENQQGIICKETPKLESYSQILGNLLEWLMSTDGSSQNLKINLYSSLVVFLQLIKLDDTVKPQKMEKSFYISRLDNTSTGITFPGQIITSFGERLVDLICNDCIGGHHVTKVLAMNTFGFLIGLSGNTTWIVQFVSRGYLKHLVDGILSSDKDLELALEPLPQNLRVLYLYIGKMSLLMQLASTRVGAELLLEQGVLSCLSNMHVFTVHPEILKQIQMPPEALEDFIPPVHMRYLQIFLPTLHLCNSIVTTLSSDNLSAVGQIIVYLISHLNVVEFILMSASTELAKSFLEELSILTSLLARTVRSSIYLMDEQLEDNRIYLLRIERLMLGVLSKFYLSPGALIELLIDSNGLAASYQTSERLLLAFQVIANVVTYVRNLLSSTGVLVTFRPSLGENFMSFNKKKEVNQVDKSPTLGVLVQHLVYIVGYYHEEKTTLDFLQTKAKEIPDMSSADLKEFLKLSDGVYDVSVARENALELVADRLRKKKEEFEYCALIIDNLLYLLWVHLDYYMLRAIPKIRPSYNLGANGGGEYIDLII